MSQSPIHKYELTPFQAKVLASKKRFVIVNAGRRVGKTWLSGAKIMDKALNYNNKTVVYVAPTHEMARQLIWDEWIKEHIPEEYITNKNEARMDMWFVTGSKLYCRSADNPDRLRGLAADLLIVDEVAMISPDFYEVVRPILADRHHDGEALYVSTPRGYNWFYKLFVNAENDTKNWDTFQCTTLEGGNVTEEEIEQNRKEMSPRMFAQEYLASFENLANRIYYNYDRKENSCELNVNWGKSGQIHVGMDFNVNPMTAVISHYENGVISIFDEIVEKNSNTEEMCRVIKARYPHCQVCIYPDPTGKKRQTNAPVGMTDFDILRRHGFMVYTPRVPYLNKDKENGVNSGLLNAKGQRNVKVAKGTCPHLREAWQGYTRKESGDPDKSSGYDHICDAAAYLICFKIPFFRNRRVKRPVVTGY